MTALSRYFFRHLIAAIGLCWLSFAALLSLVEAVDELGDGDIVSWQRALLSALFQSPQFAYESLPFAALVGSAVVLALLGERREIAVMRTSGLSVAALARLVAMPSLIFMAAHFLIGEFLVAPGVRAAKQMEAPAGHAFYAARRDLWVRDADSYVRADAVSTDANALRRVAIYRVDENRRLISITEADEARRDNGGWILSGGREIRLDEGRRTDRFFQSQKWQTAITPRILAAFTIKPRHMPAWQLIEAARHLRENRQSAARFLSLLWRKAARTLSIPLLAAAGLLFVSYRRRRTNLGLVAVFSLVGGGLYHLAGEIALNLARFSGLPSAAAALIPPIILGLIIVFFLARHERR